jgi:acetyltransferase-like isoleucine patch superfamily enzyme
VRRWIKMLCKKIVDLADQFKHEEQRKKFGIPEKSFFYNVWMSGKIQIGNFTYINEFSVIDTGTHSSVVIGNHCAIGRFVHITSKTHDLRQPTTDQQHSEFVIREENVTIGNYVWIGDKVTILPGVSIGDYAVIAAHSVVTKSVLPFEIVGGLPARHIRFNDKHYRYT